MNDCPTKKVLYVEANVDGTIGGSYFSLLFLIQRIDIQKYSPIVVFYSDNVLVDKFENAGAKVIIIRKPFSLKLVDKSIKRSLAEKPAFYRIIVSLLLLIQKIANFSIGFSFNVFKCLYIIIHERVDLVHLNNTLLRPEEWILAALLSNTEIIAHERGINDFFPVFNRLIAKKLKAIICISEAVKTNLQKHGFPNDKLFRIYNGLDPSLFRSRKDKHCVLSELELNGSERLIGLIGNIKKWKGQDIACKAMAEVIKVYPEAKCLLIGSHPDTDIGFYNYIRKFIQYNNLGNNIIITGYRQDIPDILNVIDVLIHTSVEPEPFGRVLLEGMSMRKPVITNDIGAGPEIIQDGETGFIVQSGNESALAQAIITILGNEKLAKEMGEKGRCRVEYNFHIRENVNQTELLYSRLI